MECYKFDKNRLKIIDPELDISIEKTLSFHHLPENPTQGQKLTDSHTVQVINFQDGSKEIYVHKKGALDGEYHLTYPSHQIKQRSFYSNGKLFGPSKFYAEDGTILSNGWFYQGQQEGKLTWNYSTGDKYSLQRFKDGVWHGMQQFWYPNGNIKTEMQYSKGVVHGFVALYHPNGTLNRKLEFDKGVAHS